MAKRYEVEFQTDETWKPYRDGQRFKFSSLAYRLMYRIGHQRPALQSHLRVVEIDGDNRVPLDHGGRIFWN